MESFLSNDIKERIKIIPKDLDKAYRLPKCIIYSDNYESFYLRPNQTDPYNVERFYFPCNTRKISQMIYAYLQWLQTAGSPDFKL